LKEYYQYIKQKEIKKSCVLPLRCVVCSDFWMIQNWKQ